MKSQSKNLMVLSLSALLLMACGKSGVASSSSGDEAVASVVSAGCTLVTSAYDTWAATGESTATETGRIGRENLEISFNTAQNEISKLITESDIDEARNLESWTANRSPAEIFVLMGNVQRFINSMESLNNMDWTAGQHVSNDGRMEAVKESCEIFKKSTNGMSQ